MEIFWTILVLQAFICGILSSNLAEHKGHSSGAWFASGFFLGIFGLIAAAGLPRNQDTQSATGLMKKCPDCAETIRKEASVCKFCARKFSKEQIVSELIENLQDKSTTNKLQALDALRTFKDSSIVPHVIKLVETMTIPDQMGPNVQLLNKATLLLAEIGNPSISTELASILKKTGSMIKANKIVEILGSFRDPSTIPALVDSLQKQELHDSVAKSLTKFGESALPHLERLVKDGKRSDRKIAEQIITKIKSTQLK